MESWKLVYTEKYGWVIVPKIEMRCPICGAKLILHDFRSYHATHLGMYHADVHMKCPRCGGYYTFGIAISEEEHKKIMSSKVHGKTLTKEVLDVLNEANVELSEEDEERIRKRLEQLGYWGG